MLTLSWNPPEFGVERGVDALNRSYGGGWSPATFRWYLGRRFAGRSPDVGVLFRDRTPVAGSGINYRQLRCPDGGVVDVGIATAAWTVPEERGRGHFTRLMSDSAARAGEVGCGAFLAFVTADNPSRKGLARCGAQMIPSAYLLSTPAVPEASPLRVSTEPDGAAALAVGAHDGAEGTDATIFHYRDPDDWSAQILERAHPVEVLRVGADALAVVERTVDTDRLQWWTPGSEAPPEVIAGLAARAAEEERKFFAFGTGAWTRPSARAARLELRDGSIACIATSDPAPPFGDRWQVHSGDRM